MTRDDALSFDIAHPEPACRPNLAGWQAFFGLGRQSKQSTILAECDAETSRLTWKEKA